MSIRYVRPQSSAARWSRRMALAGLVLFAGSAVAHRFAGLDMPSFVALAIGAAALSALGACLAAFGFWRLWQVGAKGGRASFAALVLSLAVLAPMARAAFDYRLLPPLHEVTTDLSDPPAWIQPPAYDQAWLSRPATAPERARRLQDDAYPEVAGRRYEGGIDRVIEAVRLVMADEGITTVAENGIAPPLPDTPERPKGAEPEAAADPAAPLAPDRIPIPADRPDRPSAIAEGAAVAPQEDVLIQGVYRSPVFGFPSDVAIRLSEEAETTSVDMRVSARYGPHDLGSGADLITDLMSALDSRLLGIAGN